MNAKDLFQIVLGCLIGASLGAIIYYCVPIPWPLKIAIGVGLFGLNERYEWKSKRVKLEREYKEKEVSK